MNIRVIGIRGYGITHGCCSILSNALYYKCSIEEFGNLLYEILNKHPFEEYCIEYNIDTSAGHPTYEDDDIVRYSFEKRRVKDKEL